MTVELESYLDALGKTYDSLVESGVLVNAKLIEIYPGALTLYLQPQDGVDLAFAADDKVFESVLFTLERLVPEETLFDGVLPEPYALCRTRDDVLDRFGTPDDSKGPLRLPEPLGDVGGWDSYGMKKSGYERLKVVFKYDVELKVTCLAFSLAS